MEIWKEANGFEGLYEVSNYGNVKSVKFKKEKIMLGSLDKDGYIISTFRKNNIKSTLKFHRLIAESFIENLEKKPQINHINGIKNDNRIDNLEWCTAKENIQHAVVNGLKKSRKGIDSNFYGLTGCKNIKSVRVIDNSNGKIYNSIKEASEVAGIKYNIMSKNLNGQNKNKTTFSYFL